MSFSPFSLNMVHCRVLLSIVNVGLSIKCFYFHIVDSFEEDPSPIHHIYVIKSLAFREREREREYVSKMTQICQGQVHIQRQDV